MTNSYAESDFEEMRIAEMKAIEAWRNTNYQARRMYGCKAHDNPVSGSGAAKAEDEAWQAYRDSYKESEEAGLKDNVTYKKKEEAWKAWWTRNRLDDDIGEALNKAWKDLNNEYRDYCKSKETECCKSKET